jgi:two-component system response regulator MtrA
MAIPHPGMPPDEWPSIVAAEAGASRVLVVDDDPAIEEEVVPALVSAGYVVSLIHDAEAIVSCLDRIPFDLVLLNTILSGRCGVETCRALRGQSDVPVIFLSARGALEDRISAFEAGADDYIVRPVDHTELVCRLQAVLRRTRGAVSGQVLMAPGGVALDVRAHEVRVGGAQVATTPREFDVLRLLLQRRGEVLTLDVISSQIWGYETFGSHNFVEAQLSRLRAKLRAAGACEVITTVRGVGYVVR